MKYWELPMYCSSVQKWINKLWLIYLTEYFTVDTMNKLDLHLSVWINLKNMVVCEKASCTTRYICGTMPCIHFKNKNNMLVMDVCTHSRSIKNCIGKIHATFGVGKERSRDRAKGL